MRLWYDARRTLQAGSMAVEDPDLLQRYAQSEDQYGQNAGEAYRKAAAACMNSGQRGRDCLSLLQRGLTVSIRDGDRGSEEWFVSKLHSVGYGDMAEIASEKTPVTSRIRVPGGIEAIFRIVAEDGQVSKGNFLEDFSRIVLLSAWSTRAQRTLYRTVSRHFEIIEALEGLGRRDGDRITIELSLSDSLARQRTRKVLNLLGWDFDQSLRIQPAPGAGPARRQQTAASLALDEIALQEALGSRRNYFIEMRDDWVPITYGEAPWRELLYGRRHFAGGFTQALAGDPDLARLYAGISKFDETTSQQLIRDFGLKILHEKYADLLCRHAPNLVVQDGRAVVPGGLRAAPLWEGIVGASPSNAPQFFGKLLRRDEGKLLSFFSCLMQLDAPHQDFFSASADRVTRFYKLFRESPEVKFNNHRNTPFQDMLSQLPLDSKGHILFPGGPKIWMIQEEDYRTAELAEKSDLTKIRVAAPDVEDAILSRLARTTHDGLFESIPELAGFLAVVRVDAHRSVPLDEASARLLAREYLYHRAIWPYLTTLTGLSLKEYTQLFGLRSRLGALDILTLNDVMGEFHAIAKLLCLLQQFQKIDEKQAASIFGNYCERLGAASTTGDLAAAALQAISEVIQSSGALEANPDMAIRNLLIKPGTIASQARWKEYQKVLDYQKVPSLATLFGLQTAAANLRSGRDSLPDCLSQMNEFLAAMPAMEFPESSGLKGKARESLSSFRLDGLYRVTQNLAKAISRDGPDKNKLAALSIELLGALNPQVRLALAGILYAFYFRPADLLISEDPSFLRRQQFVRLNTPKSDSIYTPSEIRPQEEAGSFLIGGFGNLSGMSGLVSLATSSTVQDSAKPFAAAVLASIRDTNWQALKDEDLRIVGLRIRAAREWVIRSATDPEAMSALAESGEGLLSAGRQANLLGAIRRFQWDLAWTLLSAGDLFFLGERYFARFGKEPSDSPTIAALRRVDSGADLSSLRWLGSEAGAIFECSHPHLLRLPPFESFENSPLPDRLAERSDEFKLYLVELFDRAAAPAEDLESVAEPLAIKLFSGLRMNGFKDWKSVLKAYSGMDESWIKKYSRRP